MKYVWVKLNEEEIPVETVKDEHDPAKNFVPSFWWWGRRYYLEDFIRVHNNPWVGSALYDEFPEYIHGMEADNYHNPLFIEIIGDEVVNVYEEKEVSEDE